MKENTSSETLVMKRFRTHFKLFKELSSSWKHFILVTIFPMGITDSFKNVLGALRVLLEI